MVRPTAKNASRILTKMMQKYKSADASKLLDGFGYHLITRNYEEHIRLHTLLFNIFSDAPNNTIECPNGWTLSIQKFKPCLTKRADVKYGLEDDKLIFNATGPDGVTIHMEQIAMPLKIYLDKCISHIIYNFTRLFGRKEGNNFFEALEGFSLQTIKEEGDKLGESSEVQPFEWGKSHAQLVAEKALRRSLRLKAAAEFAPKCDFFKQAQDTLLGYNPRETIDRPFVCDDADGSQKLLRLADQMALKVEA